MSKKDYKYQDLDRLVELFFEESLTPELLRIRKDFALDLLDELRGLRKDIYRIKKDDPERYAKVLERLSQFVPGCRKELTRLQKFGEIWKESVFSLCDTLPETVWAIQAEERFEAQSEDYAVTKSIKKAKKVLFDLDVKLFKRSPETYYWKNSVPLRKLVLYGLFCHKNALADLVAGEYAHIARSLGFLLDETKEEPLFGEKGSIKTGEESSVESGEMKGTGFPEEGSKEPGESPDAAMTSPEEAPDHESTPKESRSDLEAGASFRIPVIEQIEEHLNNAIRALTDYHDGSIPVSEVIGESRKAISYWLRRIGTVESLFRKPVTDPKSRVFQKAERETQRVRERWLTYIGSQITDLQVQMELAQFGSVSEEAINKLRKATHIYFRDLYYLPTEEGISVLREMIESLKEQTTRKRTLEDIEKAREKLHSDFYENSLYVMRDSDLQEHFMDGIHQTLGDLELQLNDFTEKLELAEKRVFSVPVPVVVMDDFYWRSIATRYLKDKAFHVLDPEKQKFRAFLEEQLVVLEETAGIIDVNLQAALTSEHKEGDEAPLAVAVSGLNRAIAALERSIGNVRKKQDSYGTLIDTQLPQAYQQLAVLMQSRSYDSFELRDKALQVKTTALSWKEKAMRWYAVWEDRAELAWRYSKRKYHDMQRPVSRFLGFRQDDQTTARYQKDLTGFLTRSAAITKKLPYIYQRLYKRSFMIEKRFYVDDQNNVRKLLEAHEQWQKNTSWSAVVVGQKGSGKSTLLHFFLEQLDHAQPVVTLQIDDTIYSSGLLMRMISRKLGFAETDNMEELIEKIQKRRRRGILIFEGLQNIYIRNINGYEAIRDFWVLMTQTHSSLFWVVTCSESAWEFFVRMFSADQFFSQVLRTDRLTASQIEQGIMTRHKATGYELEFEPGNRIKKLRSYKKLLGKEKEMQQYLKSAYFEQLSEIADGNFSIAMIFWLQSIRDFDDSRFFIAMREVLDIDLLDISSRNVLFALASLIQHDTLKAEELSLSLHIELSESKLILGQLSSKGLVVNTHNGYTVNHLVYRQIKSLLADRNILH